MKYRMGMGLALCAIFVCATIAETNAGLEQETRFAVTVFGNNKPVAGAKVYIDGELRGVTDRDGSLKVRLKLVQKEILPGSRVWEMGGYNGVSGGRCVCIYFQIKVRIEKDGFAPYEEFISVPYNLRIMTYFATLSPP